MRTSKLLSLVVIALVALASTGEAQTPNPPPQPPNAQAPAPEAQTPTPPPVPAPTPSAPATTPPQGNQSWRGRGYFHVSMGGQSQEQNFADSATFDIYGEKGASGAGHSIGGGDLFDVAVGARVWKSLGVGLAYSANKNKNDAIVSVRVPHPIQFGQTREATVTTEGLRHSENAVHLQFMWILPVTSRFQLAFMGGPSFFTVRQDVASPVRNRNEITDVAPFTSFTIRSVGVTEYKDSPVGVNAGVDGTFLIRTIRGVGIGVGGFVRYAGATLDLPVPADVTRDDNKLKLGGPQAGGGLRLRF